METIKSVKVKKLFGKKKCQLYAIYSFFINIFFYPKLRVNATGNLWKCKRLTTLNESGMTPVSTLDSL